MNATLGSFIAVGAGAAIGAWLRWGLSLWLNTRLVNFPLGTFVSNMIGGYLIGLALAYHSDLPPQMRLFVITGFLGGLTTFSTFSSEVVALPWWLLGSRLAKPTSYVALWRHGSARAASARFAISLSTACWRMAINRNMPSRSTR